MFNVGDKVTVKNFGIACPVINKPYAHVIVHINIEGTVLAIDEKRKEFWISVSTKPHCSSQRWYTLGELVYSRASEILFGETNDCSSKL